MSASWQRSRLPPGKGGLTNTFRITVLVAGLCLGALDQTQAQRLTPDTSARRSAFADLKPGQRMRLAVPPQGRVQGRLVYIEGEQLRIQTKDGLQSLQLAAIDSMWVRENRGARGFLAGWLVTSAGFAAITFAACEAATGSHCVRAGDILAIAGISAVAGVFGGLVGGAIAHASAPWRLRIP